MKQLIIIILSFLSSVLFCSSPLAKIIISIEYSEVVICPSQPDNTTPPTFDGNDCTRTKADNIDPQNTAIWVKAKLNIPQEMQGDKQPHSVYISGKTSSKAYLNGHYLGNNGTPSLSAKEEFPGKIDTMFYVKPSLIKHGSNELVLFLSSHHGFLNLKSPINFIGFGVYSDPSDFIQHNIWYSFIPLGALILGALYFAVSCFSPYQRETNILFLLMSCIAASQLIAELSRSLFSYSYPFQDIRLLFIVTSSVAFGICLLTHIATRFEISNKKRWIGTGVLSILLGVMLVPGFDPKTAVAILISSLFSMIILTIQAFKFNTRELWAYVAAFTLFTLTIIINLSIFHNLIFYYIIAGVLGFLFTQQALKLNKEQSKRKQEELQVAKLQLKLEQNEQKIKPTKIKINSSGKIELISANDIRYCKAAGDYVEIYLKDNKERLFSGSLKELEAQLPSSFLRVHRSYVVNFDYIVSLKNTVIGKHRIPSGSGLLLLDGDIEVPVSRRIMPMVRSVINR